MPEDIITIFMVKKVEYSVISRIGDVEVRKYGRIVIATVLGHSDNDSFRLLFNYIQGDNRPRKKIAMTSPVISSEKIPMTAPVISGGGSFSFVLPDNYDIRTAPEPLGTDIKLEEVHSRTLAVLRFSGRSDKRLLERKYQILLSTLKENGIVTLGSPFLMRYNSPFMPGPFRRNEVAVKVRWRSGT